MSVVVAGHTCLDIIPAWQKGDIKDLKPGHMLEMEGIEFSTGGVVPNTGLALNKLGIETSLIGKVADDIIGRIIIDILKQQGDTLTDHMIVGEDKTSSYTVVLNPENTDRMFLHYPGPNDTFTAGDIPYQELGEVEIFHFGYPPLLKQFYRNQGQESVTVFKKMQGVGALTSLDMSMPDPEAEPGRQDWEAYLENVLPYVNIFAPSIEELLFMIDKDNYWKLQEDRLEISGELLLDLGVKILEMGAEIALIKLGSQGLYLVTGKLESFGEQGENYSPVLSELINPRDWSRKQLLAPCFLAEVVGTTGAGDTTIAGFLAALLQGERPARAMEIATAVGAHCVESLGATTGLRPLSGVKDRIDSGWQKQSIDIPLPGWEFDNKLQIWIGPER